MNTIFNHLLWPLVDFQLGATLLLGIALGGVWLSRQPARRVALGWAAALALVALGLAATIPAWPRWHSVKPVASTAPATPPSATAQSPIHNSALREQQPLSPAEHEYASTPAQTASYHAATISWKQTSALVIPWLTRLFLLGASAISLWLLVGIIEAIWLCRTARSAPAGLLAQLREIQGNRTRLPRLLLSSRIHNAVALGILRPTILLPSALAEQADENSLRAVLAHELAHIRNRDLWLLGLMRGLLIVLFPHPLYWMIRRLIRDSQEALADAVAAQSRENDYAEGLVAWMRQVTNPAPVRVAAAMGIWERRSELSRRIGLLLDDKFTVQTNVSRRLRFGIVALVGSAALVISLLSVRPASATDPGQAQLQPLVLVPPPRDSSHSMTVTADTKTLTNILTYTGRVIDKMTRAPVEGATVHVKRDITPTEHRSLLETTHVTDTNGQFTFTLTPEQAKNSSLYLDFEVTHPKYARRPWDGYALGMIRKNISLGEQPFFQNLDLAPAESISGTVLNPDGTSASGVKIMVYSKANKDDWSEYGSFDDTHTDASGRFTINVAKGEAVLWLLPQQFSPSTHLIHQQRGDLGRFTLENGIRISGQALDSDGKPVAHLWVNAELYDGPAKMKIGMPVADALGRSALTDEHGQFTMGPLPAGVYDLLTSEYARKISANEDDHTQYPEPDAFLHQKLHLDEGQATKTVEIRAVPHVLVGIQQLNSKGQPHKSHGIDFFGKVGGASWWGTGRPDANGRITVKVPKGLTNTQFQIMVNEHQSTRYRWSDDAPWRNENTMRPAIVDQDSTNVSIMYYTSPIILLRAQAPDGSAITNFSCSITYPEGRKPYENNPPHWINGITGDVNFEKQQDGRWRSEQLLPNEKVQLTVQADGYQSWTNSLTLPEGATKEVVANLEK
jgi:beta-lactamase regulating signal transducer with metallopeptidase domain